jgi:ABC-type bacteriocin/lantibiotic exporter with double-glycine peptidase domain
MAKPLSGSLLSVVAILAVSWGVWQYLQFNKDTLTAKAVDQCCGPASLDAVAQHFGLGINLLGLLKFFPRGSGETNLLQLRQAANEDGMSAIGMQLSYFQLTKQRPIGIIHVYGDHFVAIVGYAHGDIYVKDPVRCGVIQDELWSKSDLSDAWDGRILVISLKHQVVSIGRRRIYPHVNFQARSIQRTVKKSKSMVS